MNAATMPRAPVIAFQPAIAAARDASEVWSLTTDGDPDVDRRAAGTRRDRRDPQHGDVGRERVGDQRREPERAAEPHRDQRPEPVRRRRPRAGTRRSSRRRSGSPMMPTSERLRSRRSTLTIA